MKSLSLCVIAPLVLFHIDASAQATQDRKPCETKSDWILQVQKPDSGWDVSIVDRSHKVGAGRPAIASNSELNDVVVSEYALRRKYFLFTEVVMYPCDHSVSLRAEHLSLTHAYGYSLHGKTFALALFGNCGRLEKQKWVGAGCDTYITLTDTKGSGRFDLLRIGRSAPESVPQWAMK